MAVGILMVAALGSASCQSCLKLDDYQLVPPGSVGGWGGSGAGNPHGGTGGEGGAAGPGPEFDRFCRGQPWSDTLIAATVGELGGEYLGVIADPPLPAGTLETMKIIPEHPFHLTSLRLAFGGPDGGTARIRVMTTFGRSYPGGWPDITAPAANLIEPVEIEVLANPDPESWIEIDLSSAGVFLAPTQHYLLVYEQLAATPQLAIESLLDGEVSRAQIEVPNVFEPYGLDGNFRMEARGDYFCEWTEADRWFGETADTAFAAEPSGAVETVDLDGDGHDDVVLQAPGPKAYFGDGTGSFAAPGFDPFPEVPAASLLVFADLDNDGDRDAFAATYVTVNGDGDGYTILEGDCDDTDPAVHPGAAELLDGRDNDCDGQVDEDFVNHILLNDGQGRFTVVPGAGVETLDPSAVAAFGDGNGDGKLDLYWGNWLEHYPDYAAVQDRYVEGQGDGTFVDATVAAGLVADPVRPCYGVAWNDYDGDGFQDVYVSNYQLSDNYLWRNQGDGTFVNVAAAVHVDHDDIPTQGGSQYPGGHSYAATFGDIDLDGDMDFFLANLSHPRTQPWADPSQMLINGGAPDFVFQNHREEMGIIYDEGDINAAFADYDNDTYLDLVVASIYPTHYLKLYRNNGGTSFTDVTYEAGVSVHSGGTVAWSDVNEDGALDLLVAGSYGPAYLHLFINRAGSAHHWVELELEGTATNRDAIGARVTLTAGGVTQLRDVAAGGGNHLQHSHLVHFGLGDATTIDSVTVHWVGGSTEDVSGVVADGRFRVVEGSGQGVAF